MNTANIVPVNLKYFNNTSQLQQATIRTDGFPLSILDKSSDYEVYVKKVNCPVNNPLLMPIDLNSTGYRINLRREDKDVPYYDLVYGSNYKMITGRIYSVQDFVDKLNEIISTQYHLGSFAINDDGLIVYTSTTIVNNLQVKVFFDRKLTLLVNMGTNHDEQYQSNLVEYFSFADKAILSNAYVLKQFSYNQTAFYKIQGIRLSSSLPTQTFEWDNRNPTGSISSVIYEVSYNAEQLRGQNDILLVPSFRQPISLISQSTLNEFSVTLSYVYTSGEEYACYLDVNEFMLVSLSFERIEKILIK